LVEGIMKPLFENPYVQDILSQPDSLQKALAQFDDTSLKPLAEAVQHGKFDRIVLTGMGSSLNAAYPAWLTLVQAGLPATWVDTSELIHHASGLITPRTLYWLFSQSGRSAEIVSALDFDLLARPGAMLATVNDLESPLAEAAANFKGLSGIVRIDAAVEQTVSTRTYVNSLALSQLAAMTLSGQEITSARTALQMTATAMREYLASWEARLHRIGELLRFPKRLVLLGRGASLAATFTGAFVLGEAAKYAAVPIQAGELRHGLLELAGPDLSALVFAGPPETSELNARLLKDLRKYEVNAFWVGANAQEWQIEIPEVAVVGMPLVEILPIQLLSLHLAQQIGVEPGHFFRSGKVTLSE
jgi:glucosamine--fructose-6-phosphate aminotransferase (isomerizing)